MLAIGSFDQRKDNDLSIVYIFYSAGGYITAFKLPFLQLMYGKVTTGSRNPH